MELMECKELERMKLRGDYQEKILSDVFSRSSTHITPTLTSYRGAAKDVP